MKDMKIDPHNITQLSRWFRTSSDGMPWEAGLYQTTSDPDHEKATVLWRMFDGHIRWGASDTTPARAYEHARKYGYLLTAPMYYRGLGFDPMKHEPGNVTTGTTDAPITRVIQAVQGFAEAFDKLTGAQKAKLQASDSTRRELTQGSWEPVTKSEQSTAQQPVRTPRVKLEGTGTVEEQLPIRFPTVRVKLEEA